MDQARLAGFKNVEIAATPQAQQGRLTATMRATPAELRDARWSRFVLPPLLGRAAALLLFWWLHPLIQPKTHGGGIRVLENVEVLAPPPPRDGMPVPALATARPDDARVGKECVSTFCFRGSPD